MSDSVAEEDVALVSGIRESIEATARKSRRVYLKTLLREFGAKNARQEVLERIERALEEGNVTFSPRLVENKRDDWITLSVVEPPIVNGDIRKPDAPPGTAVTEWLSRVIASEFTSEKAVEIRFVLPLLEYLGYSEEDRADGYPVDVYSGVKKTRGEVDFVLFDGANRSSNNSLLIVEAKNVGKNSMMPWDRRKGTLWQWGSILYVNQRGGDQSAFVSRIYSN